MALPMPQVPVNGSAHSSPASSILRRIGYMFYLVDPKESMFETLSDYPTPGYITQVRKFIFINLYISKESNGKESNQPPSLQAIPYFMVMLFLEIIIRHLKGMKAFRLNDGLMSISHGIMMMCVE